VRIVSPESAVSGSLRRLRRRAPLAGLRLLPLDVTLACFREIFNVLMLFCRAFSSRFKHSGAKFPEQINIEKVYLLCKDLLANPCREMLAGGLCPPLSKHFKCKML
jgi:hypothetical protein